MTPKQTVLLKRSSSIKKNMVEGEHYTLSNETGTYKDCVFLGYQRGEDKTKVGLIVRECRSNDRETVVPITEGLVAEWLYKATEDVDLRKDPLTCGRLAEMYIKYKLTTESNPHTVAYKILIGNRPWK